MRIQWLWMGLIAIFIHLQDEFRLLFHQSAKLCRLATNLIYFPECSFTSLHKRVVCAHQLHDLWLWSVERIRVPMTHLVSMITILRGKTPVAGWWWQWCTYVMQDGLAIILYGSISVYPLRWNCFSWNNFINARMCARTCMPHRIITERWASAAVSNGYA